MELYVPLAIDADAFDPGSGSCSMELLVASAAVANAFDHLYFYFVHLQDMGLQQRKFSLEVELRIESEENDPDFVLFARRFSA